MKFRRIFGVCKWLSVWVCAFDLCNVVYSHDNRIVSRLPLFVRFLLLLLLLLFLLLFSVSPVDFMQSFRERQFLHHFCFLFCCCFIQCICVPFPCSDVYIYSNWTFFFLSWIFFHHFCDSIKCSDSVGAHRYF